MKNVILFLCLSVIGGQAVAGGAVTGGSTWVAQVYDYVQQTAMFAQQAEQLNAEMQTADSQIKNLMNPASLAGPDFNSKLKSLTNKEASMMAAGKDIGNSVSRIDAKMAATFNNPTAMSYSDKFKSLSAASSNSLTAATQNAGLHRENFSSDAAALDGLVAHAQAADGNLGAVKALAEINAAQLSESMKMRELQSAQNIAVNTAMLATAQQKQDAQTASQELMNGYKKPAAPVTNSAPTSYKEWGLYTPK